MGRKDAEGYRWKNRIVGSGLEDPEQLMANARNWRVHPRRQREALRGLIKDVGIVQEVIVNQRTGALVDGHLRVDLAMEEGQREIPVKYVDLSPEEEAEVLAALDPIGAMAVADAEKLDDLLRDVSTGEQGLQELLAELYASVEKTFEHEEDDPAITDARNALNDVSRELPGIAAFKDDTDFPLGESAFDAPAFLPHMLLDVPEGTLSYPGDDFTHLIEAPYYMLQFGTGCRLVPFERTIVAFYTHDEQFETIWADPAGWASRFVNAGVMGVVAPNFSQGPLWPKSRNIWQRFRSRWMARYFQECGLKVVPDVLVPNLEDLEWELSGIPEGAPAICFEAQHIKEQAHADRLLEFMKGTEAAISPQKLVVICNRMAEEEAPNWSKQLKTPLQVVKARQYLRNDLRRRYGISRSSTKRSQWERS